MLLMLYIYLFLHQTTTLAYIDTIEVWLYIYLFLHQTTTQMTLGEVVARCISIYSYIKPQPLPLAVIKQLGCISIYSYIKPQHR